jgi:hypothetical protein
MLSAQAEPLCDQSGSSQSEFDWNGKGRARKYLSRQAGRKHFGELTGHRLIIRCLGLNDVNDFAPRRFKTHT